MHIDQGNRRIAQNEDDCLLLRYLGFHWGCRVERFTPQNYVGMIDHYEKVMLTSDDFYAALARLVEHGWIVVRKGRYVASRRAKWFRFKSKYRMDDLPDMFESVNARFTRHFLRENAAFYESPPTQ